MNKPLRVLILGATGAVGREVLKQALANERITIVIAPTRRPLPAHSKLQNPVIDFAQPPLDADWWQVDAIICALGTTLKVAGSQAAFTVVDRDLPILFARQAQAHGATRFALNSSLGASLTGNFYLRTKAEAEAGIRALNYPQYTIVRPSLIDTHRQQSRPGEALGLLVARALKPLIPKRYRAVKAEVIAHALLESVLRDEPGEQVIESEQLQ